MLKEIRARITFMAPWMKCNYGTHAFLHFEEVTILSCCGVQQGQPLDSKGSSFALQPLEELTKSQFPEKVLTSGTLKMGLFEVPRMIWLQHIVLLSLRADLEASH